MNTLLQQWYGIYPQWLDAETFQYQNRSYLICDCLMTEKQFYSLLEMNQAVVSRMGGGYIPIRNLHGQYITQKKVLFQEISISISLNLVYRMSQVIWNTSKTLLDLREKWIEKVEFVKQRYLYEVDCHQKQYPFKMCLIRYHVGLAKTAITALNDLIFDYPQGLLLNTLCHRRLMALDFKNIFNPLNFISDNRARDLCDLYLHEIIDVKEVMNVFESQRYSVMEMQYFYCRLLYPSWFFDLIEAAYFNQESSSFDDNYFLVKQEKHLLAIRQIHSLLAQKIRLKPLDW